MKDLDDRVSQAIRHFWRTRNLQAERQGMTSGRSDSGLRAAVTGGRHLDGFVALCRDLLIESGLPEACVFWRDRIELPGYYRAEKKWDFVAVVDGQLLAVVEFKGQVGPSFGNNFINRTRKPWAMLLIYGRLIEKERSNNPCVHGSVSFSCLRNAKNQWRLFASSSRISRHFLSSYPPLIRSDIKFY